MKRFPYLKATFLSAGYFTSNVAWSVYSIYVPLFARKMLLETFVNKAHIINTLVGIIMILDNVAALFIQPYIGELSDRTWVPKLGRRMPFIILGIPLAATFFGLIGSFHSTLYVFLLIIIGFNISMAFFKTPVMSLIPDFLPREYRSQGSGVLNVVGGLASLTGLFVSSYFYKYYSPQIAFWAISGIMMFCLLILVVTVREKKDIEPAKSEEKVKIINSLKNMVTKTDKALFFMLLTIFFFNAGYYVGETFLSSYVTFILGLSDYAAAVMLGVFMGYVILSAIPAGYLGRRIGPANATLIGLIGFILGISPITIISIRNLDLMKALLTLNDLTFSFQTVVFALIIAVIGFCYILASINSVVVIWDMAPQKKIATYIGYFYVFTSLAAILSPFFAGLIFDLVGYIFGKTGLKTLFVYVTTAFVIALILATRVIVLLNRELKRDLDKMEELKEKRRELRKRTLLVESLLFGQILRIRAVRKLRKLQRKERKELKENFLKMSNRTKKERREFARQKKQLSKEHEKEWKRFREQIINSEEEK
ncbi:MAG: MFS transporter [Candidatus Heimdallarchaeaceae archaeon]